MEINDNDQNIIIDGIVDYIKFHQGYFNTIEQSKQISFFNDDL